MGRHSAEPQRRQSRARRSVRSKTPLAIRVVAFSAPAGFLLSPLAVPAYAAPVPVSAAVERSAAQSYTVAPGTSLALSRDRYTVTVPVLKHVQQPKDPAAVADSTHLGVAPRVAAATPGSAQAIAATMVAAHGWGTDQYACLVSLWNKESGWNVYAYNPNGGAYGIPQSFPGAKMASAGADWQTNPATQITWGLGYIAARYGTPCAAWANSQAYNSY